MKSGIAIILAVLCLGMTLPPQKLSPRPLTVSRPPVKMALLIWTDSSPTAAPSGYKVQHSQDLINWSFFALATNKSLVFPMTNQIAWTNHYWSFLTNSDGSITTNFFDRVVTNCYDFFRVMRL